MKTALTPEILITHGFLELKKRDYAGKIVYRLNNLQNKWGKYDFAIEIVLNPQYPESNPNCGIVSLYTAAYTVCVVPEDLLNKENWTEKDQKRVDNNIYEIEESRQPIAWHVTTYERLRNIVKSLTLTDLEYGK